MMHLNSLLRKERRWREKKEKENLLEFSTSKDHATMIRVFEEIS